jgi:hypothetical protein
MLKSATGCYNIILSCEYTYHPAYGMFGFHIGGLICHIIAITDEELNRKL